MAPVEVNPMIHVGAPHQHPPTINPTAIIDHYQQHGVVTASPKIDVTPTALPPYIVHNHVVVSGEPQPLPQVKPYIMEHPDYHHPMVENPSVTVHPDIPEPTVIVEPIVRLHETAKPGSQLNTETIVAQPTCGM